MEKQEIRMSLCGGEKCCPEVVVNRTEGTVEIGEQGNLVKLDKRAWNTLVEKIRAGELVSL